MSGRWGFGCALALLLACSQQAEPQWPSGAFWAGDAAALVRVLEPIEGLRGTPLAREALRLKTRLKDCSEFVAVAEDGELRALVDALRCDAPVASLTQLRGDASWVFGLPIADGLRVVGRGSVDERGSVRLEAELELGQVRGLARLLVTGEESAGPARLSTRDVLVHMRLRPEDGLDLSEIVEAESQADRMFALRNRLFAGAVLGDAWEFAIYLPGEGRTIPPMALGVDVERRGPALAALESFVRELEAAWPIHAEPGYFGELRGACIFDLRILPEFAPCYAVRDDAMIVGWNPESVHRALRQESGVATDDARDGLVVHLDRFATADALLRRALAPDSPGASLDYPWEMLVVETSRDRGRLRVELELRAKEAS